MKKAATFFVLLFSIVSGSLTAQEPEIVVQTGHLGQVNAFAFSPDSKLLASAGADGSVILWTLSSGRQLRTLQGHTAQATSAAFSADGGLLATSGADGTVRVWNVLSGREEKRFKAASPLANSVAVAPEGKLFAAGCSNGTIRLWDLESGRELADLTGHKADAAALAFSPDGKTLASGSYDHEVRLWETATGRLVKVLAGHPAAVMGIAWSRDGCFLASAGGGYAGNAVAIVWEAETGKPKYRFTATDEWISSLAFGPNGKFLIGGTNTRGRALRVWDLVEGKDVGTLKTRADAVFAVGFSPDAAEFAYGGSHNAVSLLDARTWKETVTLEGRVRGVSSAALSPNGKVLASAAGDTIRLWDLAQGKEVRRIQAGDEIAALAFSPWGDILAAAGRNKTLRLFGAADGKKLRDLPGHTAAVRAVAFSPDGSLLASAGDDATVRLWNVADGRPVRELKGHLDFVHSLAFTPDGRLLASGSGDTTIKVWDPGTGEELRTLAGHTNWVEALAAGPDSRTLLSGSGDETVKLWDLFTGEELKTFTGHANRVTFVAEAADGGTALSGSDDDTLRLWDLASGKTIRTLSCRGGGVTSGAFGSDGKHLVSGQADGTVKVWDRKSGREIYTLLGFKDGEWIALTPEGYFEASAEGARHLNVRIGTEVHSIDQFYEKFYRPEFVRFSFAGGELPKGETLASVLSRKSAPTVKILTPKAGETTEATSAAVDLLVTDTGGGIGGVFVYLNGSQVANDVRGLEVTGEGPPAERSLVLTVPLAAGENTIKVVAQNKDGSMESAPAVVVVVSKATLAKPNVYALVVGINAYRNESIALAYAVKDAEAFAEVMKQASAPLFEKLEFRVLTSPAETTKTAIVKAFEEAKTKVKPNDFFIFYDASHGVVDTEDEQYFLLTSNVLLLSSRRIAADALSQKDLANLIGAVPAEKKLVILDTCSAGKGGKEIAQALLKTRGLSEATAIKLLKRAIGSAVFAASSDTEQALEGYRGHGLFTYVLLEGLRGKADARKDGYITVLGLAEYVEEEVVRLSEEVFKRQQTPTIQTSTNFPIGKVR